ncbi:CD151 antigen-like [Montipora capricornis]|uniref:CD151 antigen-like n=1 Tax=Montipora capricornis TaxID=246305 RepID=UPI0035F1C424
MLCCFQAAGIAVMAVGIFARVSASNYSALMEEGGFKTAANILIAAGALVMIIGGIGCCGAMKEKKWLLLLYAFLVMMIFILEIASGIMAYSQRDKVIGKIENTVNKTITLDYGEKDKKKLTEAVDNVQKELKCCGVTSPDDWKKSKWYSSKGQGASEEVPKSCCKNPAAPKCSKKGNKDAIYQKGCSQALQDFAKRKMAVIGGIGVGIAILQILGIIFAICLYRSIGYEKI